MGYIDANGKVQTKKPVGGGAEGMCFSELLRRDIIPTGSVVITREAFDSTNGFDEDPHLKIVEDYELWLRIAARYKLKFINKLTFFYRIHPKGLSASDREVKCELMYLYESLPKKIPNWQTLAPTFDRNAAITKLFIRLGRESINKGEKRSALKFILRGMRRSFGTMIQQGKALVSDLLLGRKFTGMLRRILSRPNFSYYVCSFGGSGSTMLCRFLMHYSSYVFHIHDRNPPTVLSELEWLPGRSEYSFKKDSPVSDPGKYKVIFIYRNPVEACASRYEKEHLVNLEADYKNAPASLDEYAKKGIDRIRYEEYLDHYTDEKVKRNYDMICINYDILWDHLAEIFKALELPARDISSFPKRIETPRRISADTRSSLERMDASAIRKISKMPPIHIIERHL